MPTLLLGIALVAWLAFQAVQLVRERQQLSQSAEGLKHQQAAATKIRADLDAVATSTAKLAADGNSSAQVIVEALRTRGVTIHPQAASKPK